jgi:hypothetical protein
MSCTTIRLTPPMLRELRMQLLMQGAMSRDLELVEQCYDNGDVVVRLGDAAQDAVGREETILGAYNAGSGAT